MRRALILLAGLACGGLAVVPTLILPVLGGMAGRLVGSGPPVTGVPATVIAPRPAGGQRPRFPGRPKGCRAMLQTGRAATGRRLLGQAALRRHRYGPGFCSSRFSA